MLVNTESGMRMGKDQYGGFMSMVKSREDTSSGMRMGKKHSKQNLSTENLMDGIENGILTGSER